MSSSKDFRGKIKGSKEGGSRPSIEFQRKIEGVEGSFPSDALGSVGCDDLHPRGRGLKRVHMKRDNRPQAIKVD